MFLTDSPYPQKDLCLHHLGSVKPPFVNVVVPVTVKLVPTFVLEFVTTAPVMATLLANEITLPPVIDWLFVLNVAPPPVNTPLLVIPPLKTTFPTFVDAVVAKVVFAPTLRLPTNTSVPLMLESVNPWFAAFVPVSVVVPEIVRVPEFEFVSRTEVMATLLLKDVSPVPDNV